MNMKSRVQLTKGEISAAIIEAVASVRPDIGAASAQTILLGSGAILDSVGFITLLVELEQKLANSVDLSASFMNQETVDEAGHPFRTVGSLTDHIERLLAGSN